ncbi:hypothetical protein CDCA_CDCA13G3676 [Cyanidium caldarium]|uniref:Uncharacterized protein n=1 Tax=Cyanidium caldarium TaxID=2771 RepID=A0AAV9IZU7_CYACA|nr:hypothetical protein CDCA_CDCA13G3676 [Cyanidium caldarium]
MDKMVVESSVLLGRRDTCAMVAVKLLEQAAASGEVRDVQLVARALAERMCAPSKSVTERLLEMARVFPMVLIPYVAQIVSGAPEDGTAVVALYAELLEEEPALLVPILGSLAELPLSADTGHEFLLRAMRVLRSAPESDLPAIVRAVGRLTRGRHRRVVLELRRALEDASPEITALIGEVLADAVRTNWDIGAAFLEIWRGEPLTVRAAHSSASRARLLRRGGWRHRAATTTLDAWTPLDFCASVIILMRLRDRHAAADAIRASVRRGALSAPACAQLLPQYRFALEPYLPGLRQLLRVLLREPQASECLGHLFQRCFVCFEALRADLLRDLCTHCLQPWHPHVANGHEPAHDAMRHRTVVGARLLQALAVQCPAELAPHAHLVEDRLHQWRQIVESDALAESMAVFVSQMKTLRPSALSAMNLAMRKHLPWGDPLAFSLAHVLLQCADDAVAVAEKRSIMDALVRAAPRDMHSPLAPLLLKILADASALDDHRAVTGAFLDSLLPAGSIGPSHEVYMGQLRECTPACIHAIALAMSAMGRCQGNCPRIVLSSALRSLVRLSVCVQRFQGVDAAAAIADDVVVEPAGCVCAMSTAALADSLREAVLARVALICLLNRADDSPGSVIDQWISDLNAAEEALTVGVLLLMERSPEADRPLALVERLYRASPERLTLRAQMRALACTSCVLPTQLRMLLRRLEESNDMEAASDGDGCAAADLQWWHWLAQHIRESLRTNGETDVFWRCLLLRVCALLSARAGESESVAIAKVFDGDPRSFFSNAADQADDALTACLCLEAVEACTTDIAERSKDTGGDAVSSLWLRALLRPFKVADDIEAARHFLTLSQAATLKHAFISERYRVEKWLRSMEPLRALDKACCLVQLIVPATSMGSASRVACLTPASRHWLAAAVLAAAVGDGPVRLRAVPIFLHRQASLLLSVSPLLQERTATQQQLLIALLRTLVKAVPVMQMRVAELHRYKGDGALDVATARCQASHALKGVREVGAHALALCSHVKAISAEDAGGETARKRLLMLVPKLLLRAESLLSSIDEATKLYSYQIDEPATEEMEAYFHLPDAEHLFLDQVGDVEQEADAASDEMLEEHVSEDDQEGSNSSDDESASSSAVGDDDDSEGDRFFVRRAHASNGDEGEGDEKPISFYFGPR